MISKCKHISKSPPNCLNFVDILKYRAINNPNKLAFSFIKVVGTDLTNLSYQELDRESRKIASQLNYMGAIGKRALLIYQPGLEFITAFCGCLYAGVIAVAVYPPRPNQSISRLEAIIVDSQAELALTTKSLVPVIEGYISSNSSLADLDWLISDNINDISALDLKKVHIDDNKPAFIQYTSGSTGNPKGVVISHGNIMHNSLLINHCFEDTSDSVGVSWLPQYHDMGLIGGILQPIYLGASMILMSPMTFLQKPFCWLEAISHYKATTSGGPSFAYDLCSSKITPEQRESLDLSRWELAFTGAESVRAQTLERFSQNFKSCGFNNEAFYPCYGMAEATLIVSGGSKVDPPIIYKVDRKALEMNHIVTNALDKENTQLIVGCGKTLQNQQIVIVNIESLTKCQDGEVGEVWVSGSSIALGYWNHQSDTTETFNAYVSNTYEGPFLRTGDLGFLDNDELFITGRIKNLIVIQGRNHYPSDIELSVVNSHSSLRPGCGAAFAVEIDGAERLVIVQEIERSYLRKLNAQEIVGDICQSILVQHGLGIYAIILLKTGNIPKTSSGKVQHHICKNKFLGGDLNTDSDCVVHVHFAF